MKSRKFPAIVIILVLLAFLGSMAISAQDKYTLQVPNGLAFSDFRGYEDWQVVAVSQTEELLKVMVANPVMIDAYRAGIPGNDKHFPDGSKIAKIEWKPKKKHGSPLFSEDTRHFTGRFFDREGQQKIPEDERMGIRRV
jgi:hypothetical protein